MMSNFFQKKHEAIKAQPFRNWAKGSVRTTRLEYANGNSQSVILFLAFTAAIPAFYFLLNGVAMFYRYVGSGLYLLVAILMATMIFLHQRQRGLGTNQYRLWKLDGLITLGALASAWQGAMPWTVFEWWMRLGFCTIMLLRVAPLIVYWIVQRHLMQILTIAVGLLALAGGGFYWLEPKTVSYADGLWLAFNTAATAGYGDVVPSTAASRIFAGFIVLLGYAIFSIATAKIAALFVGEDEQGLEKELHDEIQILRREIKQLRTEIKHPQSMRK
jgi:voltage-gated potassium channel